MNIPTRYNKTTLQSHRVCICVRVSVQKSERGAMLIEWQTGFLCIVQLRAHVYCMYVHTRVNRAEMLRAGERK